MTPYGAGKKLGIKASTVSKWKHLIEVPTVDDPGKEESSAV